MPDTLQSLSDRLATLERRLSTDPAAPAPPGPAPSPAGAFSPPASQLVGVAGDVFSLGEVSGDDGHRVLLNGADTGGTGKLLFTDGADVFAQNGANGTWFKFGAGRWRPVADPTQPAP